VLGGLAITETKDKNDEDSVEVISIPEQQPEEEQTGNPKAKETTPYPPSKESSEVKEKTPDPPSKKNSDAEGKTPNSPRKQIAETEKEQNPVNTPKESTKKIGKPISSVTPLQSAQGDISEGWIFCEEMRPIRAEELPPNEFFFDKKRKAVVKREFC
jgi:hypothetical protein